MTVIVPPAPSKPSPWDQYEAAMNRYGGNTVVAPTEGPAPESGSSGVGAFPYIAPVALGASVKGGPALGRYIAERILPPSAPPVPSVVSVAPVGAGAASAGTSGALSTPTIIGVERIGSTAAPTTLGTVGSYAGPIAALIASGIMLNRGFKAGEGEGNPLKGAGAGIRSMPLPSFLPAIGGALGSLFGSHKGKDQLARDALRKYLQEKGVLDSDYNLTLSDGLKFDIGRDGSTRAYNVDFSNPLSERAVGLSSPLSVILTNGTSKLGSDLSGYIANAAMSGGNPAANVKAIYEKAGLTQRGAYDALEALSRGGAFDAKTLAAYENAVNDAFGNGGFNARGQVIGRPASVPVAKVITPVAQTMPEKTTFVPVLKSTVTIPTSATIDAKKPSWGGKDAKKK